MANLVIKLVKSSAGEKPAIRDSVRSLGLKKVGDEVKHADSPSIRDVLLFPTMRPLPKLGQGQDEEDAAEEETEA